MKQKAQVVAMRLVGIHEIENEIEVCNSPAGKAELTGAGHRERPAFVKDAADSSAKNSPQSNPGTVQPRRHPQKQSGERTSVPRSAGRGSASHFPGPLRAAIARLSDDEIIRMRRGDLADMIRISESELTPPGGEVGERLRWLDVGELSRLAFVVRRCCRNQLDCFHRSRGMPTEWHDAT